MIDNIFGSTSLRDIMKLRSFKRRRKSSFDKTGGNMDNIRIKPGEKVTIFHKNGPGCISHIWTTQMCFGEPYFIRHLIIRIFWDDEENPSVECPLGDFFGLGHGERINFVSEPLQMSPQKGKGFNCWWPMPFRKNARIEIENDNPNSFAPGDDGLKSPGLIFYYYVDYEIYEKWPQEDDKTPIGYFHCCFRTVDYKTDMKRDPDTGKKYKKLEWQATAGKNTRANGGYDRNHIILEATGKGQYVGCNVNIDNKFRLNYNWPGEGDDMIFIDDDIGKEPTIYGTGTEDYFNTAFCPTEKYSAPYHGVIKGGGFNWLGKITYYRYHIQDPIPFEKQILVTIEHGHNNHRGDRWDSTAYWYQLEPHKKLLDFPSRKKRMPRKESKLLKFILKCLKFIFKIGAYGIIAYGAFYIFNFLSG